MISLEQYLGPYANDATPEINAAAMGLLSKVDEILLGAQSDGVPMPLNPHTGCAISGDGNGGFRGTASTVGADHSQHRKGHAVDIYDPKRELASWVWKNKEVVESQGLHIERPEWTPTWVHFQDVPPASGVFAFIPNASPPLAEKLPEQSVA